MPIKEEKYCRNVERGSEHNGKNDAVLYSSGDDGYILVSKSFIRWLLQEISEIRGMLDQMRIVLGNRGEKDGVVNR